MPIGSAFRADNAPGAIGAATYSFRFYTISYHGGRRGRASGLAIPTIHGSRFGNAPSLGLFLGADASLDEGQVNDVRLFVPLGDTLAWGAEFRTSPMPDAIAEEARSCRCGNDAGLSRARRHSQVVADRTQNPLFAGGLGRATRLVPDIAKPGLQVHATLVRSKTTGAITEPIILGLHWVLPLATQSQNPRRAAARGKIAFEQRASGSPKCPRARPFWPIPPKRRAPQRG